ncbi:MAG: hypothetical protein ACYCOU_02795 [Sulfobacillus sp.]
MPFHYAHAIIDGHQIFDHPKIGTQIKWVRLAATDIEVMHVHSIIYSGEDTITINVLITHNFVPSNLSQLVYYAQVNGIVGHTLSGWAPLPNGIWSIVVSLKGLHRPYDKIINLCLQCDTRNV